MKEIRELLNLLKNEDTKQKLLRIYNEIREEFDKMPSSVRHHHTYVGGMGIHVWEVMNLACMLYESLQAAMDCTMDDVIIASFIHDFDKLGRYCVCTDEWKKKKFGQLFDYAPVGIAMNSTAKVVKMCAEYGIILDDVVVNAITFHHGGFAPDIDSRYSGLTSGHMTKLAALLHSADMISCQIYARKTEPVKKGV